MFFKEMKTASLLTFCFLTLSLIWKTSCFSRFPFKDVIHTSSGPVGGRSEYFNHHIVKTYLGIPYAKPPVGELRFKKPEPVEPWSKILVADKKPPACIQYTEYPFPWYDFESGKSEDCLYLNIWVPQTTGNLDKSKPVIFWIYGGGFHIGSSRMTLYDGHVLAAEGDVVVVTINYRLNAFGFFTSFTKSAPGNVGMFDILEALKWVNKNIAAFGGDPNLVTIAGESAGSVAVGLLCVSPLTKGLFTRAIMESGSPAYLLADNNTVNLEKGQELAAALGCADNHMTIFNDPEKVVDCMKCLDPQHIAKILYSLHPTATLSFLPNYGDEFLPTNPRIALITGNFHSVDVLIGNNYDEGSALITTVDPQTFGFFGEKDPNVNKTYGQQFIKNSLGDFPDSDAVNRHYLGNLREDNYREIREQVYTAVGDCIVQCPTQYFAEVSSRAGKRVYYYFFVHRPSTTPWAKWMGVAHFEEIQFAFGVPLRKCNQYSVAEIQLSRKMIGIWSNFAKRGNPGIKDWPLYSKENPCYLNLDTGSDMTYDQGPHKNNCDFFRPYFGFS